jgi:2'-5' RNA ligase
VDRLGAELVTAHIPAPQAPRLRLAGAGMFPARGAPRVLWMGVSGVADGDLDRLGRLARAVARGARAAGVPVERRPYRPHLTLGRWRPADRADRAVAEPLADYAGPPFDLTEAVLFRSHLGPRARHERLLTWPVS